MAVIISNDFIVGKASTMKAETIKRFLDGYDCKTCQEVVQKIAERRKHEGLESQANAIRLSKHSIYNFIRRYGTKKQIKTLLLSENKKRVSQVYKANPEETVTRIQKMRDAKFEWKAVAKDLDVSEYMARKLYKDYLYLIDPTVEKPIASRADCGMDMQDKMQADLNRFYSIHMLGSNPEVLDKYKNY
jgi:hypothetical protein